MNAYLDCIICQQRQALRILRLAANDQNIQEQVFRQVMERLVKVEWTTDPMTISKGTYDLITRVTGKPDPYQALKRQSNEEVLRLYPQLQEYVQHSADPLLTACKLAVAGNIMDFGAKEHFNIQETIQQVLTTDFAINHYDRLRDELRHASSVLLFADNAGEIVFDKLLLETMLQSHALPRITVVVKKLPILNDTMLEDARQIGLLELPNITIRYVNTAVNGNAPWLNPEVSGWIQAHDVVIAKGQANYEVLSAVPGIYFLLIAKCAIVAADTGTTTGALILKYSSSDPAGIAARGEGTL
ncbi:hypothetical protein U27_03795 [Candidatus Vecturithrix granuli]|uniref:Damage-control phosphatase ARMT1-like metal-binding domain-containing protein n=1 Tax=Vecturithrix granuli TaxID=1499967 RepID=A0A081BWX6_VECG1|nr:hypothetical protein U27_03795 [Candidatus Vecturithrix granuli]